MSSEAWQQFLISQGSQFNELGESSFVTPQTMASSQLFDLSAYGLIAVSGADAQTFLQGQLTNDIKRVSEAAQFTGYCTAKGRLLALFYAFSINEVIYLQCPRVLIPDLVKRLRMFVLRSKVLIEDVSEQFVCLGLSGNAIQVADYALPDTVHAVTYGTLGTLIRLPEKDIVRAQLIVPVAQAEASWQTLVKVYTPTSTSVWEALEIDAGIPQVYTPTTEQFVPQMINLDALGGINFKKGCYTGQEIVARTHYLGKVKRRTWIAKLAAGNTPPQAGGQLLDAQQQDAGQWVRVAPQADGSWTGLVECRLEAMEAGAISWQGTVLSLSPPPYPLP